MDSKTSEIPLTINNSESRDREFKWPKKTSNPRVSEPHNLMQKDLQVKQMLTNAEPASGHRKFSGPAPEGSGEFLA